MTALSYETALKRKNAGFPQDVDENVPAPHIFLAPARHVSEPVFQGELAYAPTLSEIIEACGDRFARLYREIGAVIDKTDQRCWCAEDYSQIHVQGPTPEEAVSNLFIDIHTSEGGQAGREELINV